MMNGRNHFTLSKRRAAALLASSALLTAGCANNFQTTATETDSLTPGSTISGKVHGGNQPVGFATVQLYTVGIGSGPGSAGTLLATTTTNQGGGFGFNKQASGTFSNTGNTYVCPTSPDPEVYVKVTGGNTQGTANTSINNSAAVFLAPIGSCAAINSGTFVNVSEVTTAATVAVLGQFINPSTEQIGTDSIAVTYQGMINSFQTITNLVNSQGLANTTKTLTSTTGYNVSGLTVTATPESAKLNTVANILSTCINQVSATSASNCSTLFTNAVPPAAAQTSQPSATFGTATDTLLAALYMFINPTDGGTTARTTLFNMAPGTGAPYQPTIPAVPTDWTIGISYASSGACADGVSRLYTAPYDLNVDGNGNIWTSNNATGGSLAEINNYGVPSACVPLATKSIAGGFVDELGNIWLADNVNNKLTRFNPTTQVTRTYVTSAPVIAITGDGGGNIYYTNVLNGVGSLYKIANGAGTDTVDSIQISNVVGTVPTRAFPDNAGDIWVTSGSGFVTEVSSATGGPNFLNNYISNIFSVTSPTIGINIGQTNTVYVLSGSPANVVTSLAPSGSSYAVSSISAVNAGGVNNGTGLWISGIQQNWIADNQAQSTPDMFAVSLLTPAGASLSAAGNTNGGFQKGYTYFYQPRNIVVDASGDVWVTSDFLPNSITEIVGAAVPIFTPYTSGISGRFQDIP